VLLIGYWFSLSCGGRMGAGLSMHTLGKEKRAYKPEIVGEYDRVIISGTASILQTSRFNLDVCVVEVSMSFTGAGYRVR
jgi:hypothetical protein